MDALKNIIHKGNYCFSFGRMSKRLRGKEKGPRKAGHFNTVAKMANGKEIKPKIKPSVN